MEENWFCWERVWLGRVNLSLEEVSWNFHLGGSRWVFIQCIEDHLVTVLLLLSCQMWESQQGPAPAQMPYFSLAFSWLDHAVREKRNECRCPQAHWPRGIGHRWSRGWWCLLGGHNQRLGSSGSGRCGVVHPILRDSSACGRRTVVTVDHFAHLPLIFVLANLKTRFDFFFSFDWILFGLKPKSQNLWFNFIFS